MTDANETRRSLPSRLHAALARWVASGVPTVAAFQKICGVVNGVGTNTTLDVLFKVFASFGDEIFYITFIPWILWEWDLAVARRLISVWGASMYIGQLLKEKLQLPRPDPSVVAQLESHYSMEYGLPSTHAMTAVCLPWTIVYECLAVGDTPRFTGDRLVLLTAACAWTVLTTLSRLYLGVHTPADLVVGLAMGAVAVACHAWYGHAMDALLLTSPYTPLVALCLLVAGAFAYPRPSHPRWVSSPGDTTIILGVVAGATLGAWARAETHLEGLTRPFSGPTSLRAFLLSVPRVLIGYGCLVAVRTVVKAVVQPVCLWFAGPAFATRAQLEAGHAMHSAASTNAATSSTDHGSSPDGDAPIVKQSSLRRMYRAGGKQYVDGPLTGDPVVRAPETEDAGDVSALSPLSTVSSSTWRTMQSGPSNASNIATAAAGEPSDASDAGSPADLLPVPPKQRYEVELPTKALTYTAVGFTALWAVPTVLAAIGLPLGTDLLQLQGAAHA